ncbi:MAG: TSUP family transporter [Alphaproteobacteria bacterium]|nr:TSUP family transporter [Alphaproteobacteria bacterium]
MALIVAVILAAAMLQGAVGFGFGLVSMPLLALMLGAQSAAAVIALCSASLSATMLIQNRKAVHFGEAAGLIGAAAFGVPVGVLFLAHAPRHAFLIGLGVFVAAFSLYSLARPTPFELKDRRWRFLAGFLGGVLGGAFNTAGPPVVIYGAMRRWPPERFLAVTQAFFLPISLMVATGHALAGFWTRDVLTLYAFALPGIIAATFIGKRIARRLSPDMLSKAVYGLCLVLGVMIIGTNIKG